MNRETKLDDLWDQLDQRTPYGTRPIAPTAPLAPFSRAAMLAADNLLGKAIVRIRRGDQAGADRLVARAAEIPFDDHERMWPGTNLAAVQVYRVLADQSELCADFEYDDNEEDEPPYEVFLAVRSIKRDLRPHEMVELRAAVQEILIAPESHGIDRYQQEQMDVALTYLPPGESGRELGADAPLQQRVDAIAAACRVSVLLLDEFEDY